VRIFKITYNDGGAEYWGGETISEVAYPDRSIEKIEDVTGTAEYTGIDLASLYGYLAEEYSDELANFITSCVEMKLGEFKAH